MNIMDLDSLMNEMDNDIDVVNMLVTEFSSAINKQLPVIKKLFTNEDYNGISREAHSIKGGARNLMTEGLEIASKSIEAAVKNDDKEEILKSIGLLEKEYEHFKFFISTNIA